MEESIKALEGIFDFIQKVNLEKVKEYKGTPRCELKAGMIMSRKVVTVPMEASLLEATEIIIKENISSVVVLDPDDVAQGVFSSTDLANFYIQQKKNNALENGENEKVADWMSSQVHTALVEDKIEDICKKIITEHIHRVYIKDEKKIVGVISTIDIVCLFSPGVEWGDEEEKKVEYFPTKSDPLEVSE